MALEIRTGRHEGKRLARNAWHKAFQELLALAQEEKLLNCPAIFGGQLLAVNAKERIGLFERGEFLVGDKELVVALVVIPQDQDLVARGSTLSLLEREEAVRRNTC